MRKATLAAGALMLGAIVLSALPAGATPDPQLPKIVLHVRTTTTKAQCSTAFTSTAPDCASIVPKGALYPTLYFVYVATYYPNDAVSMQGVTGAEFGIDYQDGATGGAADGVGIDIYGWTKCSDLEFITPTPVWPNPGGGNLMTWAACQVNAELSAFGYFYMASYPGTASQTLLLLTPRPVSGLAKVADCTAAEHLIDPGLLGNAKFSAGATADGCNPCITDTCIPTPVENTTWSGIKSLYSR